MPVPVPDVLSDIRNAESDEEAIKVATEASLAEKKAAVQDNVTAALLQRARDEDRAGKPDEAQHTLSQVAKIVTAAPINDMAARINKTIRLCSIKVSSRLSRTSEDEFNDVYLDTNGLVIAPGMSIKFTDPLAVAGSPGSTRHATILAVGPQSPRFSDHDNHDAHYPLTLHPRIPLESHHVVTITAVMKPDGTMTRVTNAPWSRIDQFDFIEGSLEGEGVKDAVVASYGSSDGSLNSSMAALSKAFEQVKEQNEGLPRSFIKTVDRVSSDAGSAQSSAGAKPSAKEALSINDSSDDESSSDESALNGGGKGSGGSGRHSSMGKSPGDTNPRTTCSLRGCPSLLEPLNTCGVAGCERVVHRACYTKMCSKHKAKDGSPITPMEYATACTKKHHEMLSRQNDPSQFTWDNDGSGGADSYDTSSEYELHNFLISSDKNGISMLQNFRNGKMTPDGSGHSKMDWFKFIAKRLNGKGVRVVRTGKQVQNKIEHIENKMRVCYNFASATGAGILERDGKKSFDDALKSKFRHFHLFDAIMKDRCGMNPKNTSDNYLDKDKGGDDDEVEIMSNTGSNNSNRPNLPSCFYDEDYYMACSCGEDREACGACGMGWASKMQKAVDAGIGTLDVKGHFKLLVTKPKAAKRASNSQRGSAKKPRGSKAPRPAYEGRGTMSASLNSYLDAKTRLLQKKEATVEESKVHQSEEELLDSIDPNLRATVALAESFKRMTDALGGDRITAVKNCSAFKKFLNADELTELEFDTV